MTHLNNFVAVKESGMTQPQPRTLLQHLLETTPGLNCTTWARFQVLWGRMANEAAQGLGLPKLAHVRVSRSSYQRWLSGAHVTKGDTAVILEWYFGKSAAELARPVPRREIVRHSPLDPSTLTAATRALDYTWDTSRYVPGEPNTGVIGTWELSGGRHFDGTAIGLQLYEASPDGDQVELQEADLPHLQSYVRSSRRGVVLASLGAAGGTGLYLLDAAHARHKLIVGQVPRIPAAYQLDDLTFSLARALYVLDDGMLADDLSLSDRAEELGYYVKTGDSAPPRSDMPELSSVGAAWLGSSLCAQYITRRLDELPAVPVFWTREATGEECAPWLLFRHKHEYLQAVAIRFAGAGSSLGRAFCVPEQAVHGTEPYERILLLLTVAMMEMYRIKVWITSDPAYAQTEGFVLAQDRAILANWVREDSVWRVATTSAAQDVAPYREAVMHAQAHSLVDGPTPTVRLQALAEYLELDWTWLVGRCRALGESGITSMLRPRSRHLTLTTLDQTLRFLGAL
ncbi:transcriptional regulator, XRE family protein [Streptomyces sp. RK31]|uniref:transcriptional regulator, XRE family protein n=1 Tax=Streptomyces sp. RK31 TaxID=2824892 RepID=UPI001B39A283|nr:transcriptional regulator, XRE family protein [Streptomyces sp. RK31]MBQ0972907.1 transcriptional regulator, XRE family protein [Streptomyces sp. RK31]